MHCTPKLARNSWPLPTMSKPLHLYTGRPTSRLGSSCLILALPVPSWPVLALPGSSWPWLCLAPPGSPWLLLSPPASSLASPGSSWLLLAPPGSPWLPGSSWFVLGCLSGSSSALLGHRSRHLILRSGGADTPCMPLGRWAPLVCPLIDELLLSAPHGFSWLLLAHHGSSWLLLGSPWLLLAPPGSSWLLLAPPELLMTASGSSWFLLIPPGSPWLLS